MPVRPWIHVTLSIHKETLLLLTIYIMFSDSYKNELHILKFLTLYKFFSWIPVSCRGAWMDCHTDRVCPLVLAGVILLLTRMWQVLPLKNPIKSSHLSGDMVKEKVQLLLLGRAVSNAQFLEDLCQGKMGLWQVTETKTFKGREKNKETRIETPRSLF